MDRPERKEQDEEDKTSHVQRRHGFLSSIGIGGRLIPYPLNPSRGRGRAIIGSGMPDNEICTVTGSRWDPGTLARSGSMKQMRGPAGAAVERPTVA